MVKYDRMLDSVFHALSDPTRRNIVDMLSKQNEQSLSVLAEPFSMSLPAVSKHVTVLEDAGIVTRRKEGRTQMLSLKSGALDQGVEWLTAHQQFWNTNLDQLEKHLSKNNK